MKDAVTPEELIEALENCYGIISSAIEYLAVRFDIKISRNIVMARITQWKMDDFLRECRIKGVEKCLGKMFSKGIEEGNERCMMWMLEKYGHHCSFLEAKEENGIDMNKGDIAGYYEYLHSEHARTNTKSISKAD